MTRFDQWRDRIAAQGIERGEIDAAQETAEALAHQIHDRPSDPTEPVDTGAHQAVLAGLAATAPPPISGDASAPTGPQGGPPGTIEALAAALRVGEVTAVELAERCLESLERGHAALNVLARAEPEDALAQARAADATLQASRRSGAVPPPLTGIPMAHKDLYGRQGWLLEAGSTILKGHRARVTASAIAALDRAGAVDMGRLNTVEFALGPDGRNIHTGHIRNPWNPAHVTGGSSSASGAAVASGAVPAALGSDTGGSVRLPAAACGVVGVKPTAGLIGRSGVFPLSGALDTVGPLTQTVRDAALMVQAMTGHDPQDPQSVARTPVDLMARIEDGLGGLRAALVERPFFDPVSDEIAGAVREAAGVMAAEGARVETVEMPGMAFTNVLNIAITNAEGATQHRAWMAERAAEYGRETLGRLMAGLFLPATAYLAAMAQRAPYLRAVLETVFADHDVILTPVWPADPPRIEGDDAESYHARVQHVGHCTRPFNYLGLPSVVLPCAVSAAGLPIALQIVGRPYEEALLLRAARGFERARAFGQEHRPAVSV
ncbi:MAG: amidase [Pseudomonadota bacterium]